VSLKKRKNDLDATTDAVEWSLLARMNVRVPDTRFTFNFATPMEFAFAVLFDCYFAGVVAPPAAQQVASIQAGRVLVALSTLGT